MGGNKQNNQNQRVKNNLRPSSSGRSAALLGDAPKFQGFSTNQNLPGYKNPTDEIETDIDEGVKVILKKLSKKDSTTKQKGLQELSELLQNSESNLTLQVLPLWPRYYNTMAVHVDYRVCEAVQQVHEIIVSKAGKNIAPYLKSLCGAWISSKFDINAVAVSLAKKSFENAFPSKDKQKNMVLFCEAEILQFISQNVFEQRATSNLGSPNHEECKTLQERTIATSLHCYSFYLEMVFPEESKCEDLNTQFLQNKKLWTCRKHSNARIRAAWYHAVASLLCFYEKTAIQFAEKIVPLVMDIDVETDPLVLPFLWNCVLLVPTKFKNLQNMIDVDKQFRTKLLKVLESYGNGNAKLIYPSILSIVKLLEPEETSLKMGFYETLLSAVQKGCFSAVKDLKLNHVSKSEITSITKTYYEIIEYLLTTVVSETSNSDEEFCRHIVDKHFIGVINQVFENKSNYNNTIFNHLSNTINNLEYCANQYPVVEKTMKILYERFYETLSNSLEADKIDDMANLHKELLHCFDTKPINKQSVKFVSTSREVLSASTPRIVNEKLIDVLCLTFSLYVEKIQQTKRKSLLHCLEENLNILLISELSHTFLTENYDSWLIKMCEWLRDESLSCELVVQILMKLYTVLSSGDRKATIESLAKVESKKVRVWTLERILTHPICSESWIHEILAMEAIQTCLVESAKLFVAGDKTNNLNLLQRCFFQKEDGNTLISPALIERLVDIICASLKPSQPLPLMEENVSDSLEDQSDTNENLDACASFIAQILPVIFNEHAEKEFIDRTFTRVFRFSIENKPCDFLSEDTCWEVESAWQDAISCGDIVLDSSLTKECGEILHQYLVISNEGNSAKRTASTCAKLIFNCPSAEEHGNNLTNMLPLYTLLSDSARYIEGKYSLANVAKFVSTFYGYSLAYINKRHVTAENEFEYYVSAFNFKAHLLNELARECGVVFNTNNIASRDEKELFWIVFLNQFLEVLLVDTALALLQDHEIIGQKFEHLSEETITLLIQSMPDSTQNDLTQKLIELSKNEGNIWCHCLLKFQKTLSQGSFDLFSFVKNVTNSTSSEESDELLLINLMQIIAMKEPLRSLNMDSCIEKLNMNILPKLVICKCLVLNYFTDRHSNDLRDFKIIQNVLNVLQDISISQNRNKFLIRELDLEQVPEEDLIQITEIVRLVTLALKYFPTELNESQWDFIRLAISSWILTASKCGKNLESDTNLIFIVNVFHVFTEMQSFIQDEKSKSSTELLVNVSQEWMDVFYPDCNRVLLKLVVDLLRNGGNTKYHHLIASTNKLIRYLSLDLVVKSGKIDPSLTVENICAICIDGLLNVTPAIKLVSVDLLSPITTQLVYSDVEKLIKINEIKEMHLASGHHVLHKLENALTNLDAHVQKHLNEKDVLASIQQDRNITLSYLLIWNLVVSICLCARSELRSIYVSWISEHQFEQGFLSFAFEILSSDAFKSQFLVIIEGQNNKNLNFGWNMRLNDELNIVKLTYHILSFTLRVMPAMARKWWNGLPAKQAAIVEKLVTAYFTTRLCQNEFNSLLQKQDKNQNINIKINTVLREVTAYYAVDDTKLELLITLPKNYPLTCVKVEAGKQIDCIESSRGPRSKFSQSLMQCTLLLTHQNGTIWDGLQLWKKNLDRKFEGVEECFICYAVIHQDTYQLPRLMCKTCKKKFHGPCLYKWFSTSNKSTCPICRNVF